MVIFFDEVLIWEEDKRFHLDSLRGLKVADEAACFFLVDAVWQLVNIGTFQIFFLTRFAQLPWTLHENNFI